MGQDRSVLDRLHQSRAEIHWIRPGLRRAAPHDIFAVGIDQRHVDAVHGRAAHQADRAHRLAHGRLPVLFPVSPTSLCTLDPAGLRPTNRQTAMAKYKSDFLNTLDERGFIHQCSDFAGLDALAAGGKAVGYIGFDCTAPSFHVGNMIVLMIAALACRRPATSRSCSWVAAPRASATPPARTRRAKFCPWSRSRPTRPACSAPVPSS